MISRRYPIPGRVTDGHAARLLHRRRSWTACLPVPSLPRGLSGHSSRTAQRAGLGSREGEPCERFLCTPEGRFTGREAERVQAGVERIVERGTAKIQWNQCMQRYPPGCLCR